MNPPPEADPFERYARQTRFAAIGRAGQERLAAARVALVGCGALGSAIADMLARSGVGFLRLIDRDFIELNNLQRQTLFDEADLTAGLPKAAAAANKLGRINSAVRVEPCVVDLNRSNVESLIADADLVLDGTDNLETRFLVNDAAVRAGKPWIYGAVIGATGMTMPILPGRTPCLRCIWPEPPPPGANETCDTAGVLAPAVHLVAALQALEALKFLSGNEAAMNPALVQIDAWNGRFESFDMRPALSPACVCCGERRFDFLDGRLGGGVATLCGRDAVQVLAPSAGRVDLAALAERLRPTASGPVRVNRFMLRFAVGRYQFSVFGDGRAIIQGTSEPDEARTLYAKYIGA